MLINGLSGREKSIRRFVCFWCACVPVEPLPFLDAKEKGKRGTALFCFYYDNHWPTMEWVLKRDTTSFAAFVFMCGREGEY